MVEPPSKKQETGHGPMEYQQLVEPAPLGPEASAEKSWKHPTACPEMEGATPLDTSWTTPAGRLTNILGELE